MTSTWRSEHNFRVCEHERYVLVGMESGGLVQPCRRGRSTISLQSKWPSSKVMGYGGGKTTHRGRACWVRVTHSRTPQLCLSAKARERRTAPIRSKGPTAGLQESRACPQV